jgi:Uma2 family endonuclease
MGKIVHSFSDLDLSGAYSYADYLLWRFSERVELIRGKIFKMSPAPNSLHQRLVVRIGNTLYNHINFKNSKCEVFSAPFDVRLLDKSKSVHSDTEIYSVVQPDICVICDRRKVDAQGCLGAPDLIVEILSPNNSKKEIKTKFELYQENGVLEYWVVFPYEKVLQQYVLESGRYVLKDSFTEEDVFKAHIFGDLEVDLGQVFEQL